MPQDPLARLPGYALQRAANAMMSELNGLLARFGLRHTDASVLLLVDGRRDVTSSQIGRVLDIQRANMVRLLNRLEDADLITRVPINGKSQAIVLTEHGQAQLASVRAIIEDFETRLLNRIPSEHRGHLLPALNALWQSGGARRKGA